MFSACLYVCVRLGDITCRYCMYIETLHSCTCVNKVTTQTFTHHIIVCVSSSFVFLCACVCVSVCLCVGFFGTCAGPHKSHKSPYPTCTHNNDTNCLLLLSNTHHTMDILYIETHRLHRIMGCNHYTRYIDSMPSFYMHINAHITHNTYNRQ